MCNKCNKHNHHDDYNHVEKNICYPKPCKEKCEKAYLTDCVKFDCDIETCLDTEDVKLINKNDNVTTVFRRMFKRLCSIFKTINDGIADIINDITNIYNEITNINNQIGDINNEIEEIEKDIDEINEQIEELKKCCDCCPDVFWTLKHKEGEPNYIYELTIRAEYPPCFLGKRYHFYLRPAVTGASNNYTHIGQWQDPTSQTEVYTYTINMQSDFSQPFSVIYLDDTFVNFSLAVYSGEPGSFDRDICYRETMGVLFLAD